MHTINLLTRVIEHHQVLAYGIIFLGLIFEGEVVVMSIGILSHLGALNIWFALLFIILGALSKTFGGYALGKYLSNKYKHNGFFRYIQKRVYTLLPRFKTKPFWSISKFIWGANNIVILFSGYERIEYKKFLRAELLATLVWAPVLLSLGYFFSYTALSASRDVWKFLATVLILFIGFLLFDKLVSWLFELFEEFYYGDNK
jgi:membrane protein DedA with SNARE-associated domain